MAWLLWVPLSNPETSDFEDLIAATAQWEQAALFYAGPVRPRRRKKNMDTIAREVETYLIIQGKFIKTGIDLMSVWNRLNLFTCS